MRGFYLSTGRLLRTATLTCAVVLAAAPATLAAGSNGSTGGSQRMWAPTTATVTNAVVSTPTTGGGYHQPFPVPGGCGPGTFNANHSESDIAVKPGTDMLEGSSKFFFENLSSFYNFYVGGYTIDGLTGSHHNSIVQGYDCTTVGTQAMPPSWTNTTDPNVDFDTQGRVYQTMLAFNAFWDASPLHPDGAISMSFSDDMGQHWVKGNGGLDLEQSPNASARQVGDVEDKQWVAVNHIPGSSFQDHVYAAWSVFDGKATKVRMAVSRDRGVSFDRAVTISPPSQVGPAVTFVLPQIDAAGNVYVTFVSFPPNCAASTIYVARSDDDAQTFTPFVPVTTVNMIPTPGLPNTRFRDGITESFAASPTYPGHLYVAYEEWSGTKMDVKFTQSTDGGLTWSTPAKVNDNVDALGVPTDQFQPSVAAGSGGAVAIAFYDRRQACPNDPSVLSADVGRSNFCIDTSLQVFKDGGAVAAGVGGNVRTSQFTWDPEQPGQHVGGLSQYPCAGARDPCPIGRGFIGDYFGLAVSATNIYALFVSTHYPSSVTAEEGGPVYYQQQVLATVPRSAVGLGP